MIKITATLLVIALCFVVGGSSYVKVEPLWSASHLARVGKDVYWCSVVISARNKKEAEIIFDKFISSKKRKYPFDPKKINKKNINEFQLMEITEQTIIRKK